MVLSAHIDHVGIGEPINGDRIYNGAMDNGSGSALLLDIARSLKEGHTKLKRSLLLVWVTGEEKGLLGSKYFAEHPTVAPKSMIADINTDMFLPIIPLKVLTVYGLAESDLGDRAAQIGELQHVEIQPDPLPLLNVFIRSDQYNFVRHGIPSLMIDVGAVPGSPEAAALKSWRTERYHAPSDDADQPVNLATAAAYEEVIRALIIEVANTRSGRNGSRTASFAATPIPRIPKPERRCRRFTHRVSSGAARSKGLRAPSGRPGVSHRRGRGAETLRRCEQPVKYSSRAFSRCIHGVLHWRDGAPRLPACKESELRCSATTSAGARDPESSLPTIRGQSRYRRASAHRSPRPRSVQARLRAGPVFAPENRSARKPASAARPRRRTARATTRRRFARAPRFARRRCGPHPRISVDRPRRHCLAPDYRAPAPRAGIRKSVAAQPPLRFERFHGRIFAGRAGCQLPITT